MSILPEKDYKPNPDLPPATVKVPGVGKVTFIQNLREKWWRLWSVRLGVLSALLQFLAAVWYVLADHMPIKTFLIVGGVVSVAAFLSRLIKQPELHDEE